MNAGSPCERARTHNRRLGSSGARRVRVTAAEGPSSRDRPDGAGSSYAPNLLESLKSMSEEQVKEIIINGRVNVNASADNVMPPFGEVEDVALYIDDIYAYLKARSDGVIERGRPPRIDEK